MKRSVLAILSVVAALTIFVPAAVQAAPPANYIALKAGAYIPTASDLDDIDADTGFTGEIAFGHHFSRNFVLEGAVGYFSTEGSIVDPFFGVVVNEEITAVPVTLTAKGVFPAGNVEPYVEGGLGVYFVDDELSVFGFSDSDDDTAFGIHLGAGVNFNLSPTMFLGIGARYVIVEINTFGVDMSIDGLMLTGNLGFRF